MSVYRTYRAPADHGTALIEPSIGDASFALVQNQTNSLQWPQQCGEVTWMQLRETARRELLRAALHYTQSYRDIIIPSSDDAIVMAGHQPSLFHPGVWFKNFVLDRVASEFSAANKTQCTAINLVIDNDVATSSGIRVPVIDSRTGLAHQESILFDQPSGGVPYEQNRVRDRSLFDSFDQRVRQTIRPIVAEPLLERLWPHAIAAAQRCENVSCALAQARHSLEGELGLKTLELPLSVICRSDSFANFALAILGDLPNFCEVYNSSLKAYRDHHHIRSSAHPVPALATRDEWTEAPFWIYGDDAPVRRAAWVRKAGRSIEISDLHQRSVRLTSPADQQSAAVELASHAGPNWKLRPRALMTTMYARMILSDLFIHGIGGAKYDQLGDQIMQRFFGIQPPQMMIVSATVQLPLVHRFVPSQSVAQIKQKLRNIKFAPELFAEEALPIELLERKRQLLLEATQQGRQRQWHNAITQVNQSLEKHLSGLRAQLELDLDTAKQSASTQAILQSREYSYCLFNLDELQQKYATMIQRP